MRTSFTKINLDLKIKMIDIDKLINGLSEISTENFRKCFNSSYIENRNRKKPPYLSTQEEADFQQDLLVLGDFFDRRSLRESYTEQQKNFCLKLEQILLEIGYWK